MGATESTVEKVPEVTGVNGSGMPVLPKGRLNPHLEKLEEEHFFHIEDEGLNKSVDLPAKFGDVKYVLMGGAPDRMERLAQKLQMTFGWASEPFGSQERYSLFKVGPVLSVSHGIGMPSMLALLQELTKVLHYAGCHDVTYVRIGTSGGIGVEPGTLVVASEGVNGLLETNYETVVLGKRKFYDASFDPQTAAELCSAAERINLPVVLAKSMSTQDYYEEQGRLDGALDPGYNEADKMAFLQRVHKSGVRNMEMEATCLAAFCNRSGIRGAMICSTLLDRLKGDQSLEQGSPEKFAEWNSNAQEVVIEWLRGKLSEGNQCSIATNQVSNCDQFVAVEKIPILDMKDWFDGTSEGRKKIVAEMSDACENVGFFYVRNHGVPSAVNDAIWDVTRRFFDQDLEEKSKIPMSKDYPYGYENNEVLVRSEDGKHGDSQKKADLKETFTVCLGPEGNVHPSMPAVRWPESPVDVQDVFTTYYREMERVVHALLRIAALSLKLDEEFFMEKLGRHIAAMRTLNYPSTLDTPPSPGQLRASPHTDYGLFTILGAKAEGSEGLQLMKGDGDWLDATIPPDCYTVNIGDMFCRWTNDKWRSTRHRVVVKEGDKGSRRQSCAFFTNPDPDALVATIDTCITPESPNKYVDTKAGEYLMMKHFSAMGYK